MRLRARPDRGSLARPNQRRESGVEIGCRHQFEPGSRRVMGSQCARHARCGRIGRHQRASKRLLDRPTGKPTGPQQGRLNTRQIDNGRFEAKLTVSAIEDQW